MCSSPRIALRFCPPSFVSMLRRRAQGSLGTSLLQARHFSVIRRAINVAMALRSSQSLRNHAFGHVRLLFSQDLLHLRGASGLAEAPSTSATSGAYFATLDGPRDHFSGTRDSSPSARCEDQGRLSAVSTFTASTAARGEISKNAGIMSLFPSTLCSRSSHVSVTASRGLYAGGHAIRHMATYERT